jgi:hypothetical protein
MEGSPIVDLETGDELADGKVNTYLYSEIMVPQRKQAEAVIAALTLPPPSKQEMGRPS